MFFPKTKTIIIVDGKKVKAIKISTKSGKPVIEAEIEKSGDLTKAFIQIKKELKTDSVRLLLSEDKTYLKLLEFPLGIGITRDLVLEKAQEVIPEKLEKGYFDWKQIETNKQNLKIQILAVTKNYLAPIQEAAQKAKLNLEAFESPSFALARLTSAEKAPHLIIYSSSSLTILIAAYRGGVFEAITLNDRSQIDKKSRQLIEFVEEKWLVKIEKNIDKNLNPVLGLALKNDIKGKDEKILNLTPPKIISKVKTMAEKKKEISPDATETVKETPTESIEIEAVKTIPEKSGDDKKIVTEKIGSPITKLEEVEETPAQASSDFAGFEDTSILPEPKNSKKIVFIILAIVVVLGIIGGGFYFYKKKKNVPVASQPEPEQTTVLPTPEIIEPSPTVALLERKNLNIQVLNGSGIAGKAGEVKSFLEELKYEEIDTGNAETYDFEKTEISIKESAKDYLEMLIDDLSEEYPLVEETETLDEDSEFDVIVTVGKE